MEPGNNGKTVRAVPKVKNGRVEPADRKGVFDESGREEVDLGTKL